MEKKSYTLNFAGRSLQVEFSRLAEQADGAVLVKYGETVALVTAVMAKEDRPELDFFPLTVDYEEKYYAAGKIYGSRFVRRETRPTEIAVLTGRMIDHAIRPLFDKRMRREVQVVVTILSIDAANDPDFPALIGASLALATSSIPFRGPISGVRVAKSGEQFMVSPTYKEREGAGLDLFASGVGDTINMIEVGAKETPEEELIEALTMAKTEIEKLNHWQEEIIAEQNPQKHAVALVTEEPKLRELVREFLKDRLEQAIFTPRKGAKDHRIAPLKEELRAHLKEIDSETDLTKAEIIFDGEVSILVHRKSIEEGLRPDARAPDEVRPIEILIGVLPRTHGSAIFSRGNTQALSVVTLGPPGDILLIQGMEISGEKRFLHHYNFPPYSTGETKVLRGPGRREIGHGALAEKALASLIPSKEEFPYTIRVVSEILSSNGSSSMASVCGASLALMDAGVPIKKHVAGIAVGLMSSDDGRYRILTDIQGPEDYHGDMDFKVAGTADGITAIQMDTKIDGLTTKMLSEILAQAKEARREILKKMSSIIEKPRSSLSPFAPRIITMQINPDKIREVIGPGGKVINAIIADTGAAIDIEDSGMIFITAENETAAIKAQEWIKNLTRELKVGEILSGKVIKILDFGAIVELLPNQEGLVHISELAPYRVPSVEDIVKIGDVIPVKIKEIQPDGRIRLSLKEARGDSREEVRPASQPTSSRRPFLRQDRRKFLK